MKSERERRGRGFTQENIRNKATGMNYTSVSSQNPNQNFPLIMASIYRGTYKILPLERKEKTIHDPHGLALMPLVLRIRHLRAEEASMHGGDRSMAFPQSLCVCFGERSSKRTGSLAERKIEHEKNST